MKWLKWVVGIVIVGAAVFAVVWGANLGSSAQAQARAQNAAQFAHVEDLLSQKTGLSAGTIHSIEAAALGVAADKASAAGVITSDQAGKLRTLVPGPIMDRVFDGIAQTIGVSDTDLFNGLSQGSSLAQLTAAHGVARDTLKGSITSLVQAEVATAQTGELLTQPQAVLLTGLFASRLDTIVDSVAPQHTATPGAAGH